MAKKRRGPLTDDELVPILDREIDAAVGWDDKVAQERQTVWKYYDGERPVRTRKGQSSFISTDVRDSVEAMHAQLLETFTGTQDLLRFGPRSAKDVKAAAAATDAVSWIVHQKNPGYAIFSDVIKSGLMGRIGVAKVWWEEKEELESLDFPEPLTGAAVDQIAAQEDVEEVEVEEVGPDLFNGTVRLRTRQGYPCIAAIPPQEFLVSSRARSLEDADAVFHRTLKTRTELREMGLSEDQIETIKGEDGKGLFDADDFYVFGPIESGLSPLEKDNDHLRRRVWVYECYIRADLDGSGVEKLWKVTKIDKIVVDREAIKRLPFAVFVALRRPTSLWGNNFAAQVIPTQNAKTALMRAIIDHTAITTNPRLTVVKGTLQNPDELRDGRLGGIVNVTRPDGIKPLEQPPLNPFVLQILAQIDYQREDSTGISRLSQGLNKDAVSKQNSAALVEQLSSNSMTRQKIIARNFAATFLIPLYYLVAEIMADNQPAGFEYVAPTGQTEIIPPGTFDVRRDLIAELHLGYGEADREAEKWLMLNQLLSADPALAPLYTPDKKFAVISKVLALKGVKDVPTYLTPPEQAQPQPNPLAELEIALRKQELELKQTEMQLRQVELQAAIKEKQTKLSLDARKQSAKEAVERERIALDRRKQAHTEWVAEAEVEVMRQQADTDRITAVASPNN